MVHNIVIREYEFNSKVERYCLGCSAVSQQPRDGRSGGGEGAGLTDSLAAVAATDLSV